MNDASEGPTLERAREAAREGTSEAFSALADETRLGILLALWDAYDPHSDTNAVSFSDLREALGSPDSGRFNYHLKRLGEAFVERTDEGYSLQPMALKLVQTIVSGTGHELDLPPTEIDLPCHRCGAPTTISYRNGWFYHRCTDCEGILADRWGGPGVLFAEPLAPVVLAGRTPEELFGAAVFRLLEVTRMKAAGVCPRCTAVVDSTVDACETHDADEGRCPACGNAEAVRVRWVCSVCTYHGSASVASAAAVHPLVEAFYTDHGVGVGTALNDYEAAVRYLSLLRAHEQELLSTDPVRVRVTVRYGDDDLELVFDESMAVVAPGAD